MKSTAAPLARPGNYISDDPLCVHVHVHRSMPSAGRTSIYGRDDVYELRTHNVLLLYICIRIEIVWR